MWQDGGDSMAKVDCRIGSLEKSYHVICAAVLVDCRIGSLEIARTLTLYGR